jgi:hypothetical protein
VDKTKWDIAAHRERLDGPSRKAPSRHRRGIYSARRVAHVPFLITANP